MKIDVVHAQPIRVTGEDIFTPTGDAIVCIQDLTFAPAYNVSVETSLLLAAKVGRLSPPPPSPSSTCNEVHKMNHRSLRLVIGSLLTRSSNLPSQARFGCGAFFRPSVGAYANKEVIAEYSCAICNRVDVILSSMNSCLFANLRHISSFTASPSPSCPCFPCFPISDSFSQQNTLYTAA